MKNLEFSPPSHPNPLDRNRSILLCRDLLVMNDWVILSCKQSKLQSQRALPGDAQELISIAVLGPGERVLMDVLVRPDGAVNSELLKLHGCDPKHAFNAPFFNEVHKILNAGFARSRVLCYNAQKASSILAQLCTQEKQPKLNVNLTDIQVEYSRFVGETSASAAYVSQPLPQDYDSNTPSVTALNECRQILSYVHLMAGSSQITDSAPVWNKSWSAAFYKPKFGPTETIKGLLGIAD